MDGEAKALRASERELAAFGYELYDLGTDFNSKEHLYYLISIETGEPLSPNLLYRRDVERIAADLHTG
ncbi:hypothetical protein LWX53_09105 [bacterium]|nr:hypothetical protein [bacterium]